LSGKGRADQPILCPSARAEPGAALIGVVGEDGTVGLLKDPLEIDQAFIDEASVDGARLEQRFRFTAPCVEDRCSQWDGCKCTVIEQLQTFLTPEDEHSLRPCGIRSACRWFTQAGPDACRVCLFVITDSREDVVADPAIEVS
jgi:hypothetical protein